MTHTTAQGNPGSLTYWARPGIEPPPSWILVRFLTPWSTMGTPLVVSYLQALFWWSLHASVPVLGQWEVLSIWQIPTKNVPVLCNDPVLSSVNLSCPREDGMSQQSGGPHTMICDHLLYKTSWRIHFFLLSDFISTQNFIKFNQSKTVIASVYWVLTTCKLNRNCIYLFS